MQTLEYSTFDKSEWPHGPWMSEPDKKQWQDEETGLPCLIVRNHFGALCGYVGVSESHPLYGKDYDAPDVEVHGCLTFADSCRPSDRDAWEAWRQGMFDRKPQAEQFPQGDSARAWKQYGHLIDDYQAWAENAEASAICHRPGEGEPDHVWWFGFDCAHYGDRMPATEAHSPFGREGQYRDFDYVTNEVKGLARQLAALAA